MFGLGDVMVGGWIASYVFIFMFRPGCCCCCLLLLLPTTSALKRCFSAISPSLGLVSSQGLRAAIALSREGLARVRIRVKLRITKGVFFYFPIVLLFVVILRTYAGRNTYLPAALDHTPCMVGCVCPVESRMAKRVVFYRFDQYE